MTNTLINQGKLSDMDDTLLNAIAGRIAGTGEGTVRSRTFEPIGPKAGNFVTDGVFRVEGELETRRGVFPWSVVVKIIRPDPARDDAAHYNYWRREALAYQSGRLERLPGGLRAPACYAVEEKPSGAIWLWLEDLGESHGALWGERQYALSAHTLGRFQAAYLLGEPMPDEPWLNRAWLRSWIRECRKFQPWPPIGGSSSLRDRRIRQIVERFERIHGLVDEWVAELDGLPRVLSHQDYYENNLMYVHESGKAGQIVALDWQFASLSSAGEDLGRYYGLSISRGAVPLGRFGEYRQLFFESYMEGMREAGWSGDERQIRWTFLVACAARSVWEVPKLYSKSLERWDNPHQEAVQGEAMERLIQATETQLDMADEAERLRTAIR